MNRGFTIVEVLLAMALFLVGITAVLGLFHAGGSLEREAQDRTLLAPAVQDLVTGIKGNAWRVDAGGTWLGLSEMRQEPVTGAPGYFYDLQVSLGEDPDLARATLVIYRKRPDRPAVVLPFLLPRSVPVGRRLLAEASRP